MTTKFPEDVSQLVENDELSNDIQPHLRVDNGVSSTNDTTGLEYINPALDDNDGENSQSNHTATSRPALNENEQIRSTSNGTSGTGNANNSDNTKCVASPPVYYSSRTGESVVVAEPIVVRHPNGVHMIQTQQCCELAPHRYRQERPLRKKHIKLLQAFSIVSIVIFFPLGIPAAYYAFRCEKEFEAGVMRGDIDLARKFAKRAERCMIFSILAAVLVAVAVFAFVEREVMKDDDEYWANRSNGAIMPTG